jgi:phage terminase large subunit
VSLLPAQKAFATSREPFPAFVGGYGSGKSSAAIARAMFLKSAFRQQNVAYYLPSFPLIEDIAFQRFPKLCEEKGWSYKLNKSGGAPYIEFPNAGRILFRSMGNPEGIVGYEVAHSILDELDTLKSSSAAAVWNRVIARNRQKMPGNFPNTVGVVTTPEGFRFVYEKWVKNPAPGYVLFRAKTEDNAEHLPPGYIENLRNTYPANLLAAYMNGEFVNLTAGSVYPEFDRKLNASAETVQPGETLHIGMDFNVTKMAAVVHVLRADEPHAVAELVNVFDTPAMIAMLKERFAGHSILVYPDASGGSRRSVLASESDLSLLRAAGFRVCVNAANPAVKDRVLAANALIHKDGMRRYRVNPQACPHLVESLEKQAYDKNGEPDKSAGFDHVIDATGYFIAYRYPIVKREASVHVFRM